MSTYPIVSDDPSIQTHYERCRGEGTSHSLAEIFAFAQSPFGMTDAVFLEGQGGCYDQFPGPMARIGDQYRKMAEAAGVSTTGKIYKGGLADYPGDPTAWVSDRGDVQRVIEAKGMACEGAVKVKMRDDGPPAPGVGLADDIVQEAVEERLAATPGLVPSEELWHDVRDEHKPTWADQIEKE